MINPEMLTKLVSDAELKHEMADSAASRNWLTLIKIVQVIIIENTELKIQLHELKSKYLNHDLHLEAIEAKADRALKQLYDQRQDG